MSQGSWNTIKNFLLGMLWAFIGGVGAFWGLVGCTTFMDMADEAHEYLSGLIWLLITILLIKLFLRGVRRLKLHGALMRYETAMQAGVSFENIPSYLGISEEEFRKNCELAVKLKII